MSSMNLNSNTYKLASSASSAAITLTDRDASLQSMVLYNSDTTYPVFVFSSPTSVTGALPTSATVPTPGKMIGPGVTCSWTKNIGDQYIIAISTGSGTGALWASPGTGD